MTNSELEYCKLKNNFIYCCSCNDQQLRNLKLRYREIINSNRYMERIKTLHNLVYVLEKRDYIRKENVDLLIEIAHQLEQNHLKAEIFVYTQQCKKIPILSEVSINVEKRIHSIISEDIGHYWKDFARELGIKEGEIDNLEDRYRSIADRIRRIIEEHKNSYENKIWTSNILDALLKVRRTDLHKKVQDHLYTN